MRNTSANKTPSWWGIADPYLRWAHHTDFRWFGNAPGGQFGILVALKSELVKGQRGRLRNAGVFVARNYVGERFVTATLAVAERERQLEVLAQIGGLRAELASPIATPRQRVPESFESSPMDFGERAESLVGVIDDGCPFAHAGLLRNGATRVVFLWDQGAKKAVLDVDGSGTSHHGSTKTDYGYGYYLRAGTLRRAIKLGTPAGASGPDENAVYEIAGQDQLRPLASHGAYVLGLAAAQVPAKNRISPSRFAEGDATKPPSWAPDTRSESALAFVQIPKDALDDSSGRWLDLNILDGIHALIDCAAKMTEGKRVTINVSYGPQTGPHDGSGLLERAIDDLVTNQRKVDELFVVVPVGNSYQSRAHAEFDLARGGGSLTWHVPPDSETPAFLEIWLPPGVMLADARIEVTSSDGLPLMPVADGVVESPDESWQILSASCNQADTTAQWVVLVALGATGGYSHDARPPHGRWTVSVKPVRENLAGVAHAYIARNDYNFGGLRRGRPSHFWLESYDPDRFMRSREDDPPAGAPRPAVRVCSAGSSSGLATGRCSGVAAGYRIADRQPALYSSGGPSRGSRNGPDWAYPTDESRVYSGVISWGTRSGASVRLRGTSAAAPQYARQIDVCGKNALPPEGESPDDADPRTGWGCR